MMPIYSLKTKFHYNEQCKLLLEGDSYFNDENVDTEKINNDVTIKGYCRNDSCKTNEDGINALAAYIYMKFKGLIIIKTQHNNYDEYLLMWISDKLFNMYHESQGQNKRKGYVYSITLNQAYEKHLKKNEQRLDYWVLFDSIKGLKEANLKYMSEFYKLLNKICNTIVDYKDKGAESKKLHKNSIDCRRQYRTLHNNIPKCNSYLYLLNKLKGIYDDFRVSAIKKNSSKNNLATYLEKLTTEDGTEMNAVKGFKTYNFNDSQCKGKKKKKASPPLVPPESKEQKQKPEVKPPSQNDPLLPTPQTGGSNDSKEPKDSGNDKGNIGGTNNNKGDPNSGNENPGGESSGPTSSTPVGSFDWRSSIFEFILKGKEYYNKASEFINDNQQKFKDAAEKISGAYNDTVENLKSAYNASSDYLNKFISNVTSQLNQLESPPKSGSSGNNLPQNSDKSPKNGNPPPATPTDPSSHQQSTPPIIPPSTPTSTSPSTPQLSQTPSSLQPITHNPAQIDPSTHKKNIQLGKSQSPDPNLKKTWNIFPTTWNGSGDCKSEVNFMNATLVCCTSKQCSLTGISITFVLIPIILLIAYKYLSFGSSKKSEKKNMKRVINFHDGNRKTKIIISSNDRSKHLKPVINSVGGKKDSLINIYKIIQADPMPFINLFFLLIFFVYKRKRDTIE
ncbi:hypothetical protein YYE_01335 [Plasmodium vinckei vinckei]|nr:hypothetical protein YYE_01335 [Plasmodium vinckei vinckei]